MSPVWIEFDNSMKEQGVALTANEVIAFLKEYQDAYRDDDPEVLENPVDTLQYVLDALHEYEVDKIGSH